MLLFMGMAPHAKQLIEVHTSPSDGAGPRMFLKPDGLGRYGWSHSEICTWSDADGYSVPVTIYRSSPIKLFRTPKKCRSYFLGLALVDPAGVRSGVHAHLHR